MAEQLVAGADQPGDVLVLLGTTLIVWVVAGEDGRRARVRGAPAPGCGQLRVGRPEQRGRTVLRLGRRTRRPGPAEPRRRGPDRVPVWAPYPRGERSPLNDPTCRAVLDGLDLTHDAAAVRRGRGRSVGVRGRRAIDATRDALGVRPRRVVASGGGIRVDDWVQALADVTDLPVDCVAVPEGGALGSAWLARIAAGLEEPMAMTRGAAVGTRGPHGGTTSGVAGAGGRALRAVPPADRRAHGVVTGGNTTTSPG